MTLTAFERKAFRGYYASHRFSQQQFRYYLGRRSTIAYVATSRDRIVGYVLGVQSFGSHKSAARILSIAVDSHRRRSGIGRLLLTAFLDDARRRGSTVAVLEVAEPNVAALQLFESEGFKKTSRLPRYYTPRISGIRMRAELTPTMSG